MTLAADLAPGFADAVHDAQRTFRQVLHVLSRPGDVVEASGIATAPEPMTGTLAAVALTLLDHETSVCLCPPYDDAPIKEHLAFHTGAPVGAAQEDADFVLCSGIQIPEISALRPGTAAYPDRSATVLLAVDGFGSGGGVTLTGPGIETQTRFAVEGLDAGFWAQARRNNARYPLGVDFLFCGPGVLAGLPRSTKIAV